MTEDLDEGRGADLNRRSGGAERSTFYLTPNPSGGFHNHMGRWNPIEDLSDDQVRGLPELAALLSIWKEQAIKLKESESARQFQEKLNREWAIETGIIENPKASKSGWIFQLP